MKGIKKLAKQLGISVSPINFGRKGLHQADPGHKISRNFRRFKNRVKVLTMNGLTEDFFINVLSMPVYHPSFLKLMEEASPGTFEENGSFTYDIPIYKATKREI